MERTIANYNVELWVVCPHCKEEYDLTNVPDDMAKIPHHGFNHTDLDVEVCCPSCHKDFKIISTIL